MQLAKRTNEADDKQIGVVDKPELPAAPGVERMFREIYERVQPHALRHAEKLLSRDEARDAFHNAMQRAWSLWRKLTPEEMSDAYLYRAVHREVIAMSRRNDRMVDIDDAEAELTQLALRNIDQFTRATTAEDVIDAVTAAMPARRRQVYLLVQRYQMTYQDVAEQLDISIGTVNTHMLRANESMRAAFRERGFRLGKSEGPGTGFKLLPSGGSGVTNV
jgi:RNA polymerase sigma-70 factor (ECF subfamily)